MFPRARLRNVSFPLNLHIVFLCCQLAIVHFGDQVRTTLTNFLQILLKSIVCQMDLAGTNIKEIFTTSQFVLFTVNKLEKFFVHIGPSQLKEQSLIVLTISDFKSSAMACPIKAVFRCLSITHFIFSNLNHILF